jgi:hypothetical protein
MYAIALFKLHWYRCLGTIWSRSHHERFLKDLRMVFVAQSAVAAVGDLYYLDHHGLTVGIRQYDIRSFG